MKSFIAAAVVAGLFAASAVALPAAAQTAGEPGPAGAGTGGLGAGGFGTGGGVATGGLDTGVPGQTAAVPLGCIPIGTQHIPDGGRTMMGGVGDTAAGIGVVPPHTATGTTADVHGRTGAIADPIAGLTAGVPCPPGFIRADDQQAAGAPIDAPGTGDGAVLTEPAGSEPAGAGPVGDSFTR